MRRAVVALLVLSAITACGLVIAATARGIGVSPDSVLYLIGARSLAAGHGYADDTEGPYVAITKLPPFFPFVVSIGQRTGLPAGSVVRALNAFLFPVTVLLAAMMAWRVGGNAAAAGTAVILSTSPVLVEIFANAWSEPLFLALMLTAMLVLERALRQPRWLPLAGAVAGIAVLDRYAGIALIVTGVLVVLFLSNGSVERRIALAGVYGGVSVLPLSLWIMRNIALARTATERTFSRHVIGRAQLEAGGATLWRFVTNDSPWKLLDRIPHNLQYAGAAAVAAIVLLHAALRARSSPERSRATLLIAIAFAAVYSAFIVASISFADASTGLDFRILSPLLVIGVVLATASIAELLARAPVVYACLFATFAIVGASVSFVWAEGAGREGIDFGAVSWQESPLMQRIRTLPGDVAIYTNATDGVHFLTGRPCHSLPMKFHPLTGVPNPRYLEELRARMHGPAVIAYFDTQAWRSYYPTHAEITSISSLCVSDAQRDGVLFTPCDQLR